MLCAGVAVDRYAVQGDAGTGTPGRRPKSCSGRTRHGRPGKPESGNRARPTAAMPPPPGLPHAQAPVLREAAGKGVEIVQIEAGLRQPPPPAVRQAKCGMPEAWIGVLPKSAQPDPRRAARARSARSPAPPAGASWEIPYWLESRDQSDPCAAARQDSRVSDSRNHPCAWLAKIQDGCRHSTGVDPVTSVQTRHFQSMRFHLPQLRQFPYQLKI